MTLFSTHTSRLSSALQRGSVAAHVRKAAMLTALLAGYGAGFSPALQAQSAVAQTAIAVQASVNINTADAASMASALSGIGLSRAEAIVRYRESFGAFTSVDELAEVKGIGQSTVDKNRALIVLE